MPPDASAEAPREVIDRLYGVGLDEFVPTRTAAAKELRGQGRRDEAAAVQALRKPSVAAWIVNRLARDEESLLANLLAAGAELRKIQLSAATPAEVRAAGEAEREALDELMPAAAAVSSAAGLGAGALERVRETLHAAALDPDLADQVRRGVVLREQQAVGFLLGGAAPAAGAGKPARPRPRPATAGRGDRRRSPGRSAAATRRLERATAAAETAREALAEVERTLADARTAQEAAGQELADAQDALTAAERRARQAERAVERAAAGRERAARRAEEAAERLAAVEEATSDGV